MAHAKISQGHFKTANTFIKDERLTADCLTIIEITQQKNALCVSPGFWGKMPAV